MEPKEVEQAWGEKGKLRPVSEPPHPISDRTFFLMFLDRGGPSQLLFEKGSVCFKIKSWKPFFFLELGGPLPVTVNLRLEAVS